MNTHDTSSRDAVSMRVAQCARTALFLASFSLVVSGQQPIASPPPIALVNAHVVDVRAGRVVTNVTVVVRDGKIASIASAVPAGIQALDVKGRYLVPGFLDAHAHVGSLAAARAAMESGVTTIRSAGTSGYADVGLRELVRKGGLPGPDVVAAGYYVAPELAEAFFLDHPAATNLMGGVRTTDEIRQVVRANLSRGADTIKVVVSGSAGNANSDPRAQLYSEAQIRAAVEEAASQGAVVLVHSHGDGSSAAAVRAGVRSIDHGTYLSDATIALMKDRGTFFVPTYGIVQDLADAGGQYDATAGRIRSQHMLPQLRAVIRKAHEAGVKVVTGTDSRYEPNSVFGILFEMAAFVEIGLSPLDALRSATIVAAELLQVEQSTGAIEPGLEADLVVVEGNPLEDIHVLGDALLVMSNGYVVLNRLGVESPLAASLPRRHEGSREQVSLSESSQGRVTDLPLTFGRTPMSAIVSTGGWVRMLHR